MDIKKYLTNKEISLTNDDIDLEKLTQDLRKGYVEEKVAKSELENQLKDAKAELTKQYVDMENSYKDMQSRYEAQTKSLNEEKLKNVFLGQGFKADQFDEVSKLRTSLYADVKDDNEAVQKIKDHFNKVYFETPTEPSNPQEQAPNEDTFGANKPKEEPKIVVSRSTPLKDLFIKK